MRFSDKRNFRRWFIIVTSLVIVSLIVWNAVAFFQRIKEEERVKMNIWASAQVYLDQVDTDTGLDLYLEIINSNSSIPTILVDDNGKIVDAMNIPAEIMASEEELQQYLLSLKSTNEPIEMDLGEGRVNRVYYGNSPMLNKLKYYPLALIVIIILFIAVIYFFYRTTKSSEQNKLWAGMAKETAHQIGTPLSSLIGWTEILKEENVNRYYITEIEKDVDRLKTITERFSKIGSAPTLEPEDIVEKTRDSFEYLKARSSKLIKFKLDLPAEKIPVNLNAQLYSWTIENLVRNAIDAMKGKGELEIKLKQDSKKVQVRVSDTGKGIPKSKFKRIFEPGFTTKKRGWGLGLSLSKRIIEKYHGGRIKVLRSEINKGTTIEIQLHKIKTAASPS
ncbi:HAMP domain-containing histidine kinase [Salinimicrobium tongyeongense]|uniref:histidine kinase n=1 Tax=Salinimicrobium tongyeongense TaxID=2809707 RepID=A0ABY6NU17_9FLAO|nr:HAMP domain-containing sensor histidine kinase [Salinimicrobium tongyeongense]UZH56382.1 HAMP domain-containing histidine kinase [Salinimicrobium tongyeongense]